jgi:hypothetical protein
MADFSLDFGRARVGKVGDLSSSASLGGELQILAQNGGVAQACESTGER